MKNLESRIEKLEKGSTPSDEPVGVVWLPAECQSVEEWMQHVQAWQNGQPIETEWRAISSRGTEEVHFGVEPPTQPQS